MLTDCGNVTWTNLNKTKLNNGYIHLPQTSPILLSSSEQSTTNDTLPTAQSSSSIMDYESLSDAAPMLLESQEQQPLNRDTSILLLDVNQHQSSGIINNPVGSTLTSPQHAITSIRNSISSSTSPTNKSQSAVVHVINLGNPNSMQTITTLQRNNVNNSSTKSNGSRHSNISIPIANNIIKPSDNINIIKPNSSSGIGGDNSRTRKYKFNLFKLEPSVMVARTSRNRLLIIAIFLIIFGIAIGALTVHLSGIYQCNSDSVNEGMSFEY